MKTLFNVIIILFFIFCSVAHADQATHRAAAEELLILTKTDQMMKPFFKQMGLMMERQFDQMGVAEEARPILEKYRDKLIRLLEEQLGWDKMKDDFITIYVETYTEDEIRDISAFYKTPAGQKFIEKMPLLMQKSMEISQKKMPAMITKMQQITVEMAQEMQDEVRKKQAQETNQTNPKEM
jgi:hypothetical protein